MKALLLCSDFPPLQSASAQRSFSWFKYLPDFGISVVAIVRNHGEISRGSQLHEVLSGTIGGNLRELKRCGKTETGRDAHLKKHGSDSSRFLRKIRTTIDSLLGQYFLSSEENSGLYRAADTYLSENNADVIIASASPFVLFRYASLLSDKYNIPWIADYRDEWKGNYSIERADFGTRLLYNILALKERAWTKNASAFTSVSPQLLERISRRIGKKPYLVRNGVDHALLPEKKTESSGRFILFFAGTVYDSPYLDILENGMSCFLRNVEPGNTFKLVFAGIEINRTNGSRRIESMARKWSNFISILPSMKQEEVLRLISESALCLSLLDRPMSSGIYSAKIFDYLAMRKPVISIECGSGFTLHEFSPYVTLCRTSDEFSANLESSFRKWQNNEPGETGISAQLYAETDRKFQCGKLAGAIKEIAGR